MFCIKIACPIGRYGSNCQEECSFNCGVPYRCNLETGQCQGGCQVGWKGVKCDLRIILVHLICFSYTMFNDKDLGFISFREYKEDYLKYVGLTRVTACEFPICYLCYNVPLYLCSIKFLCNRVKLIMFKPIIYCYCCLKCPIACIKTLAG